MSMECDFDFDHIIRGTDDHKNHFDFVQNARRMEWINEYFFLQNYVCMLWINLKIFNLIKSDIYIPYDLIRLVTLYMFYVFVQRIWSQ